MKKNNGITLIALVVTIVVLLILAGVAINSVLGDDGIIAKAQVAKEKTETAEIKEMTKEDIVEKQIENKGSISKNDFVEILNKYFENVPKAEELPKDLSTLVLTSKEEFESYNVKISEIYNGKFTALLAKDLLKIDMNSTLKTPWVMYNGIKCRVLYDSDSEYGLQIVTSDKLESLALGSDTDYEVSREAYNTAIDTINAIVEKYKDTKGIATLARSVGTDPLMPSDNIEYATAIGTNEIYKEMIIGKYKKSNGETFWVDSNQLDSLGIKNVFPGYWMPSRVLTPHMGKYAAYILNSSFTRLPVYNYNFSQYIIATVNSDGTTSSRRISLGVRGAFTISPDAVITEGDGTKEFPYVLDI